jgi:hypothetical protein
VQAPTTPPPQITTRMVSPLIRRSIDLAIGSHATLGVFYAGQLAGSVQDHAAEGKFAWRFWSFRAPTPLSIFKAERLLAGHPRNCHYKFAWVAFAWNLEHYVK